MHGRVGVHRGRHADRAKALENVDIEDLFAIENCQVNSLFETSQQAFHEGPRSSSQCFSYLIMRQPSSVIGEVVSTGYRVLTRITQLLQREQDPKDRRFGLVQSTRKLAYSHTAFRSRHCL